MQTQLEEPFEPEELQILYLLKRGKYYYTDYKVWNDEYNFGWSLDRKEAILYASKEEIINFVKLKLKERDCNSFSAGDIYKIREELRVTDKNLDN